MSKTKSKESSRYFLRYDHYLTWGKRIHVLQEGSILTKDGVQYIVKQIIRSPIEEQCPRIVLTPLNTYGKT